MASTRTRAAHFRATNDVTSTRQPRPAPRRTSTRQAAIAAHLKEI